MERIRTAKKTIIAIGFVIILCAGFIPATEPAKPSEWGANYH